jgi:hypothetical protein
MSAIGIYDKMASTPSSYQMSTSGVMKGIKNGRPESVDTDNDSTASSQDQGTNTSDMKSFSDKTCPICGEQSSPEWCPCCSRDCQEQYEEDIENLDSKGDESDNGE